MLLQPQSSCGDRSAVHCFALFVLPVIQSCENNKNEYKVKTNAAKQCQSVLKGSLYDLLHGLYRFCTYLMIISEDLVILFLLIIVVKCNIQFIADHYNL